MSHFELNLEWLSQGNMIIDCRTIHDGSCYVEFLKRFAKVSKIGMRYYILFHMIPLILKLRGVKNMGELRANVLRNLYYYCRSILFMGTLVSITKGGLCVFNNAQIQFGTKTFATISIFAGSSIWWQERSRQREIGYFVLAKALRSIYVSLKRKGILSFSNEQVIMHVLMMGMLSYLYHHQPDFLKEKKLLQHLWGSD